MTSPLSADADAVEAVARAILKVYSPSAQGEAWRNWEPNAKAAIAAYEALRHTPAATTADETLEKAKQVAVNAIYFTAPDQIAGGIVRAVEEAIDNLKSSPQSAPPSAATMAALSVQSLKSG